MMRSSRLLGIGALALALACGGDSSSPSTGTGGGEDTMSGSAESGMAESAQGMAGSVDPQDVASCLDLVTSKKYANAVPVCMRAAKMNPDDTRVKQALETAQQGAAQMDEATQAAMDSAHGAASTGSEAAMGAEAAGQGAMESAAPDAGEAADEAAAKAADELDQVNPLTGK
jgi:hypothetical protein